MSGKKGSRKANLRRIGVLIACATVQILAFQNCSNVKVGFANQSSSSQPTANATGNGGSYDGKPDTGSYYRVIPNYKCNGKAAIYASLDVDENGAKLATLSSNCGRVEKSLSFSDLHYSRATSDLVGFQEGAFEKRATPPDPAAPAAVVEVWCQEKSPVVDFPALSIFVKTNSTLGTSRGTIVQTSAGGASQGSTYTLDRNVSGNNVTFSDAASKLDIDLSSLPSAPITFPGHFKGTVNGVAFDRALDCRSGNLLDQKSPAAPLSCPAGYLAVPQVSGTSTTDICVAKYEAKQNGAAGISRAGGLPWVNIDRNSAISACRANGVGYDLIANSEWQTVARNIELVPANWCQGTIGHDELNTGHSDNAPAGALAASIDDNASCFGTGQTCDLATWDRQRRVHMLSSGQWIWDMAGNVSEWTKDNNAIDYGFIENEISKILNQSFISLYGPSGIYSTLAPADGGFGVAVVSPPAGGVYRSGYWGVTSPGFNFQSGGVFSVGLDYPITAVDPALGFRCVYHP